MLACLVVAAAANAQSRLAPTGPVPKLPAGCTVPVVDQEHLRDRFMRLVVMHGGQRSGLLIAQMTFHSPTDAPEVQMVFDGGDQRLADLVRRAVQDYRLDCVEPGKPIKAFQEFNFVVVHDDHARLKRHLQLVDLIRLTPPAKLARVKFDTQQMRCPFDIQFAPYRPWMPNRVAEVGEPEASRRPLLQWIASLELDIPLATMRTAIGQVSIVQVPCTVIDLT